MILLFGVVSAQRKELTTKVRFEEVAEKAGIDFQHVSGGAKKDFILESVGGGVALLDYDNDGWMDIYLVNGSTFEAQEKINGNPIYRNKLFRNQHNWTFVDVTDQAGVGNAGWGMGAAIADFDNDGFPDIYVTNFGKNILYHNNGDSTFSDVTQKAGVAAGKWSTGAAWGDYDRDGDLDLYVTRYVDFDRAQTPPKGSTKFCQYRGVAVQCGPRGLKGLSDILYRNNGDGTFTDVTQQALGIKLPEYYGFTPLWVDINGDNWPDIFVANDGTPNLLYKNRGDGTLEEIGALSGCAYSGDGREQAGMGADFGDYDRDGKVDIFITTFSNDYNTLFHNEGRGEFRDATEDAKLVAVSWNELGWAAKFFDFDLDGWLDLFVTNGHVYPEVDKWQMEAGYRQHPQLLHNQYKTFRDVTAEAGADLMRKLSGRGAAFGDLDNDGDVDIVVNNIDGKPSLLRCDSWHSRRWIMLSLQGTRSNRDAIGAKVRLRAAGIEQFQEVHQSGGFLSSNDIRVHFGLGESSTVDELEISWPSGLVQKFKGLNTNRVLKIKEGKTGL